MPTLAVLSGTTESVLVTAKAKYRWVRSAVFLLDRLKNSWDFVRALFTLSPSPMPDYRGVGQSTAPLFPKAIDQSPALDVVLSKNLVPLTNQCVAKARHTTYHTASTSLGQFTVRVRVSAQRIECIVVYTLTPLNAIRTHCDVRRSVDLIL